MLSELVVVMKDGHKQGNVVGAVLAAKDAPPFASERDGYRLRWWGPDHPVSQKLRSLVEVKLPDDGNGHIQPGDVCRHVDLPDFLCKVTTVDDGKCMVEVLRGWRGRPPLGLVPIPTAKLEGI